MKPEILFISPGSYTFVQNDVDILTGKYSVNVFHYQAKPLSKSIFSQIKLFFLIIRHTGRFQFIYIWFADYHSFLPSLLGKLLKIKTYIVIGGYDAAKLPAFGYGVHTNTLRSWVVKKSCCWATKIFPVSLKTKLLLFENIDLDLSGKTEVIYNLANDRFFSYNPEMKKKNKIICVSRASDERTMKIKGIDFFTEVAIQMPYCDFVLVGVGGIVKTLIESQHIPNLMIFEYLPKEYLISHLQEAKVICQFSQYESFGVALAEGMLAGCIPVSIKNLGAAEVIDENYGILIDDQNINHAKSAIEKALSFDLPMALKNRERILQNFSYDKRKENIFKAVASAIK